MVGQRWEPPGAAKAEAKDVPQREHPGVGVLCLILVSYCIRRCTVNGTGRGHFGWVEVAYEKMTN